jgi:hypothetical protein
MGPLFQRNQTKTLPKKRRKTAKKKRKRKKKKKGRLTAGHLKSIQIILYLMYRLYVCCVAWVAVNRFELQLLPPMPHL